MRTPSEIWDIWKALYRNLGPHSKRKIMLRAWYDLRTALGLKAWYHSTDFCFDHMVPRIHKVDTDDNGDWWELCPNGPKRYGPNVS